MLGSRRGFGVWAGIEFFHEEVDLIAAQEVRDNAEAPFLERGGDCVKVSHACLPFEMLMLWTVSPVTGRSAGGFALFGFVVEVS